MKKTPIASLVKTLTRKTMMHEKQQSRRMAGGWSFEDRQAGIFTDTVAQAELAVTGNIKVTFAPSLLKSVLVRRRAKKRFGHYL